MRDAVPLKIENGTTTFSGNAMRIDTDALAHFALGFLWKAAVYPWSTLENQIASVDLGGIEDGIRTYLLGKNEFPAGLFVLVAACEDIGSRGMVWAPSKITGLRTRMFSILVRGLWFHIALNQDAPAGMKELCCVQSANRVLHRENCTERFLDAGRPIYRTARIASNLRRPS